MRKKAYVFLLAAISFVNCTAQSNLDIKGKYCAQENKDNELTVMFSVVSKTVYLSYINIVDNGNYINGFDDPSDIAGEFSLSDVHNSEVSVKIKNYRDPDDEYTVKLKFLDNGKSLSWDIEEEVVAYLPKHAKLTECK